ncbi:hypothetical protein [Amycolatopsis sp. cmx-4-83]|uniref:hypothetical protein n=1 Tax=Amycolatopsis sp. cmx-4-83 TaxID=2790940 RepID=UPI003979EC54
MSEPAVPDVYFTDRQIAAVRHVVEHRLGGEIELAYLAGSLAVGLGHGTSDVDVYAVGDHLPGQDHGYEHDGVVVHVTKLDGALVRRLAGLGSRFTATGADREQFLLEFKVLNALVRLTTGHRVKVAPAWQDALAPLRRDVVRRILVARHANIFAAFAEDVWGALLSGDRYTAATASAIALENAAEALLAAADDLYVGPKFLFRRLRRTEVTAPWAGELWRLLNQVFDAGLDDVETVAAHRLRVGNLLLSWCVTEGWDKPLAELPPPAAAETSRRSPYFAPVRFSDGIALMSAEEAYAVDESVVAAWRDADRFGLDGGELSPALRGLLAIGALDGPDRPGAEARNPRLPADPAVAALIRVQPGYTVHPQVAPVARP